MYQNGFNFCKISEPPLVPFNFPANLKNALKSWGARGSITHSSMYYFVFCFVYLSLFKMYTVFIKQCSPLHSKEWERSTNNELKATWIFTQKMNFVICHLLYIYHIDYIFRTLPYFFFNKAVPQTRKFLASYLYT